MNRYDPDNTFSKLKKHLSYIAENSPYYQEMFRQKDLDVKSIQSLSDFTRLPFTTKSDLSQNEMAFHCTSTREIVEYVSTSGTSGEPISIALTKADIDRLSMNEKEALQIAGITENDVVQITTTLDKRFMAGMAYYLGAVDIGATVIRSGIGDMLFQFDNIKRYKPTVLIAVPSFAYKLGHYMMEYGMDPAKSSIKKIVCIGEPIRNQDFSPTTLSKNLQELWDVDLRSTYASTEMATAFTECEYHVGGHENSELIFTEIIREDGSPAEPGELGEVVVTPLAIEGMPLIRYKTGDLAKIYDTPCECGLQTRRLGPIEGRKDQMIKFKGTTLFPESIYKAMHEVPNVDIYVIELTKSGLDLDHLCIHIPIDLGENVAKVTEKKLSGLLRVRPQILQTDRQKIVNMITGKNSRKPVRFIDSR